MAAPVVNINTSGAKGLTNLTTAESTTGWAGFRHAGGGTPSPVNETNNFVQGTQAVSHKVSGTARDEGIWFTFSSTDLTANANKHVFVWAAMTDISQANVISGGGLYIIVASSDTNWNKYYVAGSDTIDGRFVRYVIDITKGPSVTSATAATLTAVTRIGIGTRGTISAKAENLICDRIDYGTGLQIEEGDSTTPCSWPELFAIDDNINNKYGIIQKEQNDTFTLLGGLTAGDPAGTVTTLWDDASGSVVKFKDAKYHNGTNLVSAIDAAVLYGIEIVGNSTGTTDFTLGSVVGSGDNRQGILGGRIGSDGPKWTFDAETDIADLDTVNLYGVTLEGAGNIQLSSSTKTDCIGCVFTRCDEIQPNTAEFLNNTVIAPVPDRGLEMVASHNIKQIAFVAGSTADQPANRAWQVDQSVIPVGYVDETTDFNSSATADVLPFPAAENVNDYFAVGSVSKFAKLRINTSTARSGGTLVWEYRTSSGWSTLSVTDGTNTLSTTGLQDVTFTPPTDWVARTENGENPLFYVRLRVTATMSTNPVLTQGFIADVTEHHLHVPATGTYTAEALDFFGFAPDGAPKWMGENSSAGLVTLNASDSVSPITDAETHETGGGSTTVNNNVSVTLTGLPDNTEVRVYTTGTQTERAGIENATAGSPGNRSFTFTLGASEFLDIVIHNVNYEHLRIVNFDMPSTNSSIPITLRFDRNMLNPAG